jgi:hypothetical protein
MTDTPDYTKRNPLALIGQTSVDTKRGLALKLYKPDGSPNYFVEPTNEECMEFLDKFIEMTEGMDMRTILFLLGDTVSTVKNAVFSSMSAAHHVAHSPEHNQGYDEDLLCEGVNSYLMTAEEAGVSPAHSQDITGENSQEEVLKRFFTGDTKPN